jgi:hypothetical protein
MSSGKAERDPALRARLESARNAMVEFDKVQEYDKLVASLDPSGQEVFELCASRLAANEGSWARIVEQEVITRWISSIEHQTEVGRDLFSRHELKFRPASPGQTATFAPPGAKDTSATAAAGEHYLNWRAEAD